MSAPPAPAVPSVSGPDVFPFMGISAVFPSEAEAVGGPLPFPSPCTLSSMNQAEGCAAGRVCVCLWSACLCVS